MARDLVRTARLWLFPTALIGAWLAVAAYSVSQLSTVIPSLSAAASMLPPIREGAQERASMLAHAIPRPAARDACRP